MGLNLPFSTDVRYMSAYAYQEALPLPLAKKAICAVAASILTAAYHMLRDGTLYQDLGADHIRRASPEDQAIRLARQITKLGFTCTLAPTGVVSV